VVKPSFEEKPKVAKLEPVVYQPCVVTVGSLSHL